MCSIFASCNLDKFKELAELNSYRGTHSFSVGGFKNGRFSIHKKGFGKIEFDSVDYDYYIGHQQSPTNSTESNKSIHPSEINGTYLYHNGIIKEKECVRLRNILNDDSKWDTHLLHKMILQNDFNVDGSFACLMIKNDEIYVFRNSISPLFIDKDFNISSTKFTGSIPIPCDKYLKLNYTMYTEISTFHTVNNPYYGV